jgi:hypothetical protein
VTSVAASSPISVQRIYGADAIGTSIAVSRAEFPTTRTAKVVVLARSDFFADALAGGPLAAKLGGPLLSTPGASLSSSLDPRVEVEVQRVLPTGGTVYILGGDLALSPNIDTALQTLGYVTQRIAGADEYATAVDIAEALGNPSTIFEATGLNFPDALSAVPAAIKTGGAILLTDGTTQAPETATYLAAHPGDTRYAIGGPLAAYGADPTATPVYGADLYGTSAAVASTFFSEATVFGAATGENFPDALSGGVFMGSPGVDGPVLLVYPSGPLPSSVSSYLSGRASALTQDYLFGGPLAVGDDVLSELETPTSFMVQLATTQVQVDNLSEYPNSRLATLVQWADRGMATTDPLNDDVAGEMELGDRVVVTNYGIYWLDIVRRGGLLSGIWALVPSANGADFQYVANSDEWDPNELLPGADASNANIYLTGQGVNVIATGGTDGSCVEGMGTFIIGNSDDCGIADSAAPDSFSTSVNGYDHIYTFSGTLYQEGTYDNTVMTDSYGDSAEVNFTLTYHFRDYTDTNYDYGQNNGPQDERVRVELTLQPTSPIHLGTLVITGDSDPGDISSSLYRQYDYSNTLRESYVPAECNGETNGESFAAGTVAQLCEGPAYASNFITQPNRLPNTLSPGNFVTEQQTSTAGDLTDRSMTYMLPSDSAYRLPERIDEIWNQSFEVSGMSMDYFNNEDVPVPAGGSIFLGFDIQMVPALA